MATKLPTPKQTKEQKEADFVEAVEILLGFPLMAWQKAVLLEVRRQSLAGEKISQVQLRRKVYDERLLMSRPITAYGRRTNA